MDVGSLKHTAFGAAGSSRGKEMRGNRGWERGAFGAEALESCCQQSNQEKLGIALWKGADPHPW